MDVNILYSKTEKLIEKRLKQKYSVFIFEFANVEARFKNMEQGIRYAIKAFFNRSSRIEKVKEFNDGIKRIFDSYQKDFYPTYFNKFIEYEQILEHYLPKHFAHYDHVIQVFLFGYNILTNWTYIKEKSSTKLRESFFQLDSILFSWLIASYFHDYGYIVEKLHDFFREFTGALKEFSEFHIPSINLEPVKINFKNKLAQKYFSFIFNLYQNLPEKSELSESQLKDIFIILEKNLGNLSVQQKINRKEFPIDHGIISAITYLKILNEAETRYREASNNHLKFVDWPANQNAILGIALHNFKEINFKLLKKLQIVNSDCELNLSSRHEKTLIAYLLIVCDSLQIWEREPLNNKIKLEHMLIKKNKILFQVTHRLGEKVNKIEYVENFLNKMGKLRKKLPIQMEFNLVDLNSKIRTKIEEINKLENNTKILKIPPIDKHIFLINIKHKILENYIYLSIYL